MHRYEYSIVNINFFYSYPDIILHHQIHDESLFSLLPYSLSSWLDTEIPSASYFRTNCWPESRLSRVYCVSIMPPARHIWFHRFAVDLWCGRQALNRKVGKVRANLSCIGTYAYTRVCHAPIHFSFRAISILTRISGNCNNFYFRRSSPKKNAQLIRSVILCVSIYYLLVVSLLIK